MRVPQAMAAGRLAQADGVYQLSFAPVSIAGGAGDLTPCHHGDRSTKGFGKQQYANSWRKRKEVRGKRWEELRFPSGEEGEH